MKHVLTAAILLLAGPAAAQERMTDSTCAGIWTQLASYAPAEIAAPEITVDADGWCLIEDQIIALDFQSRVEFGMLRWRGDDFARFVADGLPPRTLDLEAEGFGILPNSGDPVYDYLLALQTGNVNRSMSLSMRWDGVQNALFVDESEITFFDGNTLELSGLVDGVDLTNMVSLQNSLPTAGVRTLQIKSSFEGWFEAYVALALGLAVLNDREVPPEEQVRTRQDEAIAALGLISDDVLPSTSRDALAQFIRALPTPRGTAQLQFTAEPPLGAARVMPMVIGGVDAASFEAALDGVSLIFTWAEASQ